MGTTDISPPCPSGPTSQVAAQLRKTRTGAQRWDGRTAEAITATDGDTGGTERAAAARVPVYAKRPDEARSEAAARRFEHLYRDHFDVVYRAAVRLGGPCVDPEDATRRIFVAARDVGAFEDGSPPLLGLYALTIGVVRSMRRRAFLRRGWLRRAPSQERAAAPHRPPEVVAAFRLAHEILEVLPTRYREPLVLAELERLSFDEIAGVLGVRNATVQSRLRRARETFARHLARRTS